MCSYALLLDPLIFTTSATLSELAWYDIRRSIEQDYQSSNYGCRAEQVSASLVTLVLTDFVVSKVILVVTSVGRIVVLWAVTKRKPQRKEFSIARKMVDLLYAQTLLYMLLPLSPAFALLGVFLLWLKFKFDKWTLFTFECKPLRP